jgi:crossover junction endodeoxyribonuclease RuvC
MVILGVDPGSLITGFGVIEVERQKYSVLTYGVVKNLDSHSMPLRLKKIYECLCRVISRYHPDEFAIETAFYGKNAQSTLKIGHARGVSILAAVTHEIPTTEYSPREIKKAVTGNGAASKQQVRYMVKSRLGLREAPKLFDASDALAVTLCHSSRLAEGKAKLLRKKKNGGKHPRSWLEYVRTHPERIVGSS